MVAKNSSHPYLPSSLDLPHYVPNTLNAFQILGVFFTFLTVLIGVTVFLAGKRRHTRAWTTRGKLCWFAACAAIHIILEGYFSVFYKTFPAGQNFLDQTWKEYSLGDSRYVSGDSFTVCMETITGFIDGPLSVLAVYAFFNNKPYRYTVQLMLSLCQLYGDVLYFSTEFKEGFIHGELYHPQYFWFYFVFMNTLWIIIPSICIYDSLKNLHAAQVVADNPKEKAKKYK